MVARCTVLTLIVQLSYPHLDDGDNNYTAAIGMSATEYRRKMSTRPTYWLARGLPLRLRVSLAAGSEVRDHPTRRQPHPSPGNRGLWPPVLRGPDLIALGPTPSY